MGITTGDTRSVDDTSYVLAFVEISWHSLALVVIETHFSYTQNYLNPKPQTLNPKPLLYGVNFRVCVPA